MPRTFDFTTDFSFGSPGIGVGSISPKTRLENNEINRETLVRFYEQLQTTKFYERVQCEVSPTHCVDGRPRKDGNQKLGYNAAGGSFSIVMADALTHQSYLNGNESAAVHARKIYQALLDCGYLIGGHDDDHPAAPGCGCGAIDRLGANDARVISILSFIAQNADDLHDSLVKLVGTISRDLNDQIRSQALKLLASNYVVSGQEMRELMADLGGENAVETLAGSHNEVALVINTEQYTTLNRAALALEFGAKYQTFNLDIRSLQQPLFDLSQTTEDAQEKYIGALYYNLATAAVLADNSLQIIVR
jgi:hypothetical protein